MHSFKPLRCPLPRYPQLPMAALQGYLVALQGLGGGRAGGGGEGWKWVREVGRKLGGERKTERQGDSESARE